MLKVGDKIQSTSFYSERTGGEEFTGVINKIDIYNNSQTIYHIRRDDGIQGGGTYIPKYGHAYLVYEEHIELIEIKSWREEMKQWKTKMIY